MKNSEVIPFSDKNIYPLKKDMPILVFDSGVGGISVLKELVKILPNENFIFFGDSKNAPYGTKTLEEVKSLAIKNVEHFLKIGIKGCVIACNTMTSAAIDILRESFPFLPIVGIEPAIKPAVKMFPKGRILVMATPVTIHGTKLKKLILSYQKSATIIPLACPGLMEYIEQDKTKDKEYLDFLHRLLAPYIDNPVDAFVTGCTHYPFAKNDIQKTLQNNPIFFDGAIGTSKELKRILLKNNLLKENGSLNIEFLNSDRSKEKIDLCKSLFKNPI